jgi:tRNA G18 (ribose-2'-O)-methylase SpoU/DNA-directed RNA polymerase subunit RPC12/RpoP
LHKNKHAYYQCLKPTCRFRFPADYSDNSIQCPKCGSPTEPIFSGIEEMDDSTSQPLPRIEIAVLLDNIRSAFNVGSIFRTADGAGVQKMILSGITPPPDHPGARKTALGAELYIPWEQSWSALETCEQYKKVGYQIIVLEKTSSAVPISGLDSRISEKPMLLVVGNEINGVDPEILTMAHQVIYIPMYGTKESLNVSVAFGICVYWLRFLTEK